MKKIKIKIKKIMPAEKIQIKNTVDMIRFYGDFPSNFLNFFLISVSFLINYVSILMHFHPMSSTVFS